jgi:hypothetical protein
MTILFNELRKRGWAIKESDETLELLPDTLRTRYRPVPPAVADFLSRLEVCHNAAEDAWMLTPAEFRKTDAGSFRWNEYELMALEGAEDDPGLQSEVRTFWNEHLPIMLAVHSDYDYLAVRLAEPDFGSIVHGYAPEWESPSRIARSFEEFLSRFTEEAASREPAYPYYLFL